MCVSERERECVFNAGESRGRLETLTVMSGVLGRHMKVHLHPQGRGVTPLDKSEKCHWASPALA